MHFHNVWKKILKNDKQAKTEQCNIIPRVPISSWFETHDVAVNSFSKTSIFCLIVFNSSCFSSSGKNAALAPFNTCNVYVYMQMHNENECNTIPEGNNS